MEFDIFLSLNNSAKYAVIPFKIDTSEIPSLQNIVYSVHEEYFLADLYRQSFIESCSILDVKDIFGEIKRWKEITPEIKIDTVKRFCAFWYGQWIIFSALYCGKDIKGNYVFEIDNGQNFLIKNNSNQLIRYYA